MKRDDLIFDGYRPGALAQMLSLHMNYYGSQWNLGRQFEIYCAEGMAAFFANFDANLDYFLAAWNENGKMIGSIVIDGHKAKKEGAQLRWFIVDASSHGLGIGRYLLDQAMEFCRNRDFDNIFLMTFAGLHASRRLYESAGFQLVDEKKDDPWSGERGELVFRHNKGDGKPTQKPA
jgi:ribosomal protein S18 acetylase RimI-like enzyme